MRNGDPVQCALRCEHEARCRSWSFAYPTADSTAICWLKAGVPARLEEAGSVSGVRGAGVIAPRRGPVEFAVDRIGGDYKNMELAPDPTGMSCKAACEADNPLPRLELPASRLRRPGRALLPQGQGDVAAPAAVLHLGRGAVDSAVGQIPRVIWARGLVRTR